MTASDVAGRTRNPGTLLYLGRQAAHARYTHALTPRAHRATRDQLCLDALALLEDFLCSPPVASMLMYSRLDERLFTHVNRLRAAHGVPSGLQVPGLLGGPHFAAGGGVAGGLYRGAGGGHGDGSTPASFAPSHAVPQLIHATAIAANAGGGAGGMSTLRVRAGSGGRMFIKPNAGSVPLPLPGPSKSPFPVEQRAVLEDAFRRSATISKDDAAALSAQLCACIDHVTGAPLPPMTQLQVQNWFNNRRKALGKAALEGGGRGGRGRGGRGRSGRGRGRASLLARVQQHRPAAAGGAQHEEEEEDEEEEDDVDVEDDGDAHVGGGDGGQQGDGEYEAPGQHRRDDGSGGGVRVRGGSGNKRQRVRGGLSDDDTESSKDPTFDPAQPHAGGAEQQQQRRSQRSGAGKRLLDAGGAAALEDANDAVIAAAEAAELEMREARKRARIMTAPPMGGGVNAHQQGPTAFIWPPSRAAVMHPVGPRRMERSDMEALDMCFAEIPAPTGQQIAAMAAQLQLSTQQVALWYQGRQEATAQAAQQHTAAAVAAAAAAGLSTGATPDAGGRTHLLPSTAAGAGKGAVEALLTSLFAQAGGTHTHAQGQQGSVLGDGSYYQAAPGAALPAAEDPSGTRP